MNYHFLKERIRKDLTSSSYITGSEVIESVKQSHNAIAHYRPSLTRNLKMTNSRPVFGVSELSQYLGWRGKKDVKT